jgi:hypothetical protein
VGRYLQVTSTQTGFKENGELAISDVVDSRDTVRACRKYRESDLPSVSICKYFHKDGSRIRRNKKSLRNAFSVLLKARIEPSAPPPFPPV